MWSLQWTVFLFWSLSAAEDSNHGAALPRLSKSWNLRPRFANTSTTNMSSAPNPCLDSQFKAPDYELANLAVYSSLGGPFTQWWTKTWSYATFTLRDVANNYTLSCNMSSSYVGTDWSRESCGPDTSRLPNQPRALTLLNALEAKGNSSVGTLQLVQYWYCETINGSYPQLYQARATADLDVSCVWHGETDPSYPCTVGAKMPLRFKPQWQSTGPLPGTPELRPNPSTPPQKPNGVSPLPARDCTDASFTNPDWTIKAEFQIVSRATGSTAICAWDVGGVNGTICQTTQDGLHSQSEFTVRYDGTAFNITHSWICGDTKGLHSTKFTATGSFTKNNGSTTVQGRLIQPVDLQPAPVPVPPGANSQRCLAKSQDANYKVWTVHKFYFQTTQNSWVYTAGREGSGSIPWNRTLQLELENHIINYTQTCDIRDPALDNPTDKWFPCFAAPDPYSIAQRSILTYVRIDKQPRNFTLRINQTWFCNDDPSSPYQITSYGSFHSLVPYFTPSSSSQAICGTSSHTAYNIVCNANGPIPVFCDITFSAQWCTLRDPSGHGPPVSLSPSNTTTTPLPPRSLDPHPDPLSQSCTVSSLGRGPILWTFSQANQTKYLSLSRWFGHRWNWNADQLATRMSLTFRTSVFPDVAIRNVGITTLYGEQPARFTPWLRGWDPTTEYTSAEAIWDGGAAEGMGFMNGVRWEDLGILGWRVRADLSRGYVEVEHSWFCRDKDPGRPVVFRGSWRGELPVRCGFRFGGVEMTVGNWSSGVVEGGRDREEDGIFCSLVGGAVEVVPEVRYEVVEGSLPEGYHPF